MKIIKTYLTDSIGEAHETYGVEANFKEGPYRYEDISFRREAVELYRDILDRVEIPYRDMDNFTADYINIVNKYPDAKIRGSSTF